MLRHLFLLLFFLALTPAIAQTHNTKCMRCKYSPYNIAKNRAPVKGRALDECGCEACAVKAKKEHQARQAEEKRRVDALLAKQKADAEAKEKAWKEEQQRKAEALARKKAQEEKDRQARQAMIEKYRSLADKGKVKVKESGGPVEDVDLKIVPFVDNKKKTYGFKIDTLVVYEKQHDAYSCSFRQIENSKYFSLTFSDKSYTKFRNLILNQYGEEMTVGGVKEFSLVSWPKNQIHVYIDQAEPEFVRNWADVEFRAIMYTDRASAITEITRPRSGYSFGCEDNFVVPCKQYVLNLSLDTEQTIEGYRIFSTDAKCTN